MQKQDQLSGKIPQGDIIKIRLEMGLVGRVKGILGQTLSIENVVVPRIYGNPNC